PGAVRQVGGGEPPLSPGRTSALERPLCPPLPGQTPHPPILVGGGGEKRTLRLVAKYADACNLFAFDPAALDHKLRVLRGHCEAVGRPFEEIERTSLGTLHMTRDGRGKSKTPGQAIHYFERLAERGIDQAIISMP